MKDLAMEVQGEWKVTALEVDGVFLEPEVLARARSQSNGADSLPREWARISRKD
jgi:hypothetical protein